MDDVLSTTAFLDVHTHLFPPGFRSLVRWGIDDLLTSHYLEAELFRSSPIRPEQYWTLNEPERADLIWKTLFVENPPVSVAARGVIAVLHALGLDTTAATLEPLRSYFRGRKLEAYVDRVFALAGISGVVMTNDPLDPTEAELWNGAAGEDPRFFPALRLDRILNEWDSHWAEIASHGYEVDAAGGGKTVAELRRFVESWSARIKPVYLAVSLPDSWQYPASDVRTKLLAGAILPLCHDLDIPLALMIGVRRQVNPALRLAGDGSAKADLRALERLCREFPENRFLATALSRENQHELCVYARNFPNLMPFGCWWFLNNQSVVEEITRERLEMLGTSFIPQHSGARVLEQVIYKWRNTRRTLAPLLARSYELLTEDGRPVTRADVQRDVTRLFRGNLENWIKLPEDQLAASR